MLKVIKLKVVKLLKDVILSSEKQLPYEYVWVNSGVRVQIHVTDDEDFYWMNDEFVTDTGYLIHGHFHKVTDDLVIVMGYDYKIEEMDLLNARDVVARVLEDNEKLLSL